MQENKWARLLAYVTGLVNQRLLLQNEYLAAENHILRSRFPARMRLSDPERSTLAEIGKRLGRNALQQAACVAKPDMILAWYRRLIARKFDGSKRCSYTGRPPVAREVEALIVSIARENAGWGYDRIVGALANLGRPVSDQTVGNILRRYGIAPAPQRSKTTTWKDFIPAHMAVLAGTDFFTVEVLTWQGLATYYVLVLYPPGNAPDQSRRLDPASHDRMDATDGSQRNRREFRFSSRTTGLLHDRDTKFCAAFQAVLRSSGIQPLALPPRSPNLNAFAERWVRSIKQECLSKLILFGEVSLRRALSEFIDHYHSERNHQGKGNLLLCPSPDEAITPSRRTVRCRERLGGLLRFYSRASRQGVN